MLINKIKNRFHSFIRRVLFASIGLVALNNLSACTSLSDTYSATATHSLVIQQKVQEPKESIEDPSILDSTQEQSIFSTIHHKNFLEQISSIYQLNIRELNIKIDELSALEELPAKIQLAVALSRTQQIANNKRALTILSDLLDTPEDNHYNKKYLLWASVFYTIISEQNRLQTQIAQQAQQLRQNEKTIHELNDKINALRAIEERFSQR